MEDGTIEKVGICDLWHDPRPMRTLYVKFGGKLWRRSKAVRGLDADGGRVNIVSPKTASHFLLPISPPILHRFTWYGAHSYCLILGNDIGPSYTLTPFRFAPWNLVEDLYLISKGPLRQPL
jgi:hypothetical protein